MSLLDGLRHQLRVLLRGRSYDRELDEELEFHLSLDEMQAGHRGLSSDDARFFARRRFGNVTYLKEETRRMAGFSLIDAARQDLRFAIRTLRRAPGFTLTAVLTLAIGIGAVTAIFSAVNTLLLRPLPFREPDRLMQLSLITPAAEGRPSRDDMVWSFPKFVAFRDEQKVFEDLGLYEPMQSSLTGDGDAERILGELIGGRYLPTLGVVPVIGRGILPEEDQHPDSRLVVLLGDALWKRRFSADPAVLGRAITLDGKPFTVIGVLPPGFKGLTGKAEIMVPVMTRDAASLGEKWSHEFDLVGRLRPGVTPEAAIRAMTVLGARIDAIFPGRVGGKWSAAARELNGIRVDPLVRRSLLVLLGAVACVLLIACANIANLLLGRATSRRREIGVRLAIGAGRWRLVRQMLTESLLLSLLGAAASVVVALGVVKLLASVNPAQTLRAQQLGGLGAVVFSSVRLDLPAMLFAAVLAVVTGLLFGLAPALQATRPSLTASLAGDRERPRAAMLRRFASRNVLVIAEIAVAIVLLAGSGLLLRSLGRLLAVDPGFDSSNVLTLRITVAGPGVARDSLPAFYDLLLSHIGALPGVSDVALGNCPPLNGGCNGTEITFLDRPAAPPGTSPDVGINWVSPGWFGALRVPLKRGRHLTPADRIGAPKVVVMSEAAARKFWPNEDPIGKRVGLGQGGFNDGATVVGIVGDVRFGTIDSMPKPEAYVSLYQSPRRAQGMMIYVRSLGETEALSSSARRVIREVAPGMPIYDVLTLRARVAEAMAQARFSAILLALFAGVALVLAAVGIYGVMSFSVAQRTREIGIRMALGAQRRSVLRLVVGQGIGLASAGVIVGMAAAFAATRILRSLLFDVAPSDPLTFVSIIALLLAAALLASWLPARRATRVDPTEALRGG
ncbi:MAG: ABC transporter permease [Gemmatimonadota bacterium]|nr:ABC transporter permease [Gemmatimonadota bacterium]